MIKNSSVMSSEHYTAILLSWLSPAGVCQLLILVIALLGVNAAPGHCQKRQMVDRLTVEEQLKKHVEMLTKTIGERSVRRFWNLEETAHYIENYYRSIGLEPAREPYTYKKKTVANIVAEVGAAAEPAKLYLLGAHYDSVGGTVGADDNASAIAVQLEVARKLMAVKAEHGLPATIRFVSFTLEEPPVYGTRLMGSRVYARKVKKANERIDGMICLEMVGYTCHEPGCQGYPFPLTFMSYPDTGNFIGIIGNFRSRHFTRALHESFQKNKALPVEKLTVPWSGYLVPNVRLSDHASFWDHGYKAVMITDTAFYRNPHYHTGRDTMDKLDFEFMSRLVESLVEFFITGETGSK